MHFEGRSSKGYPCACEGEVLVHMCRAVSKDTSGKSWGSQSRPWARHGRPNGPLPRPDVAPGPQHGGDPEDWSSLVKRVKKLEADAVVWEWLLYRNQEKMEKRVKELESQVRTAIGAGKRGFSAAISAGKKLTSHGPRSSAPRSLRTTRVHPHPRTRHLRAWICQHRTHSPVTRNHDGLQILENVQHARGTKHAQGVHPVS